MSNYPFRIVPANGYVTINLSGICESFSRNFEAELEKYLMDPTPFVVVNCEHLTHISLDWIRAFLTLQGKLKNSNKALRLIMVPLAVRRILEREGVDSALKSCAGLRDALAEFGLVTKKMLDTDFINPFLTATLHVLKVQASIKAVSGKVYLKKPDEHLYGDVSGVIGIVSESFNGSVVISFPEKTFLNVMSGMFGEELTEMTREIVDGAGEITNMIFGQAKVMLNEKGYGIKTAIPSVVSGANHSLTTNTQGPIVVVPFSSNAGDFFVVICLSA